MKKNYFNPKGLWIMLAVLTAGMVGCKDDEPRVPPVTELNVWYEDAINNNLTISGVDIEGKNLAIGISGNVSWTITQPSTAGWVTVTPTSGQASQTPVSVGIKVDPNGGGERNTILTITGSEGTLRSVKIVQKGDDSPGLGTIYFENAGTTVAGRPVVTDFEGWIRGGDADQTGVTYKGSADVRNSGADYYPSAVSAISGYPYVCMTPGTYKTFVIESINLDGNTNLTFKFAMQHTLSTSDISPYIPTFTESTPGTVKLQAGFNGVTYADLTYSVELDGSTTADANYWYIATSEFKVPAGTEKLYISYSAPLSTTLRLDDFTLTEGGSGSEIDPGESNMGRGLISISDLVAEFTPGTTIPDNTQILGTVVSVGGTETGNISAPQASMAIMDGTDVNSGMFIYGIRKAADNTAFIEGHSYAAGTNVAIDISGAKMDMYSGSRQITELGEAKITAAPDGTPTYDTPIEINAADMGDYQSMLVKIDCEPAEASINQTWGSAGGKSLTFMDATGADFTVYTNRTAAFINETVPAASGSLTGIVGSYNAPQLLVRTAADIDLSAVVDYFAVSAPEVSVPAGGGLASVDVSANVGWSVTVQADPDGLGLTPDPSGGTGDQTVSLTFPANSDPDNTKSITLRISNTGGVTPEYYDVVFIQAKASAPGEKTATFDFAEIGAAEGWPTGGTNALVGDNAVFTDGDVTLTFAKGTHTSNDPSGVNGVVRMYALANPDPMRGNTLTVTTSDGTIGNIEFTYGATAVAGFNASVGNFASPYSTWTGDAASIIFSAYSSTTSSQQRHIAKVVVTYN